MLNNLLSKGTRVGSMQQGKEISAMWILVTKPELAVRWRTPLCTALVYWPL
jgi:hypothetical protein